MDKYIFSEDFVWGAATSSYQIEGAWNEGGKGLNIWDEFSHTPGKIKNNETGDVACDHFHKFKEDVLLMKQLGLKAYRFSISWARIIPKGNGNINEQGIKFYSDLIDSLLEAGIAPWVTLYHWDLPLTLQLEKDGWLNKDLALDFKNYASVCFEHFGNRVKNWITFNEPWVTAILGYANGVMAPGRKSKSEPYIVAHNQLVAHAMAVEEYRKNFQPSQKGKIGISNNCDWREPNSQNIEDLEAAERALEFFLGWFADPVYFGDYPEVMKTRLGDRLPKFTEVEKKLLKGSSDFFGLNHYTTMYAANFNPETSAPQDVYGNGGISEDQDVELFVDKKWGRTSMGWAIVPWGCRKLLEWIDQRYNHPPIYITENGMSENEELINGKVDDPERILFYQEYLKECKIAIEHGVDLKGYFAWSLFDNFEWALGYEKRFGLIYIDFETLNRIPKESAFWYKKVIENNGF